MNRGIATFTLDGGHCPPWLFERMVRLSGAIIEAAIIEFGPDEVVRRMGDPVWFQSLGSVIGFDWNASGLTTVMTAAMKEALRGRELELGFAIAGGKGKTSRKTPADIAAASEILSLTSKTADTLIYNSKMAAKVDSSLLQDGFELYHHAFFFSRNGAWTVVQQGMNTEHRAARRYHWHSAEVKDLVIDPHSGIASTTRTPTLNLAARESLGAQTISTELVQGSLASLKKDIEILDRHSSELTRMIRVRRTSPLSPGGGSEQLTLLDMYRGEFHKHPVKTESFSNSAYLQKILTKVTEEKPGSYEALVATAGVGGKTLRALALVSEVIYGAAPSYTDPARYSFAHGGKDGTPHPVNTKTYDNTLEFFREIIPKLKVSGEDKDKMAARLF